MKLFQYLTILMVANVAIEAQMIETLSRFRTWEWMTLKSGYCDDYPACSQIELIVKRLIDKDKLKDDLPKGRTLKPIVQRLYPNQKLNRYGHYATSRQC